MLPSSINGLMIDCSRVLERHEYYFRLVDHMAAWGMNTLLLHFSDDHGLAVELPGVEHLAMPHAMSAETVSDLIDHAARNDISVIPELETFGHVRYITDHRQYEHLAAWPNPQRLRFNAIDPLSLDAYALLKRLVAGVCELFPSRYVHIGCDEVDIGRLCSRDGLDPTTVWADHVNRMFALVAEHDRAAAFWADHAVANQDICERLSKDAVAIHWDYRPDAGDAGIRTLQKAGFRDVIAAPATSAWLWRFLPTDGALQNIRRMAAHAAKHNCRGVITTQWCPQRYPQLAMNYGIAYAAEAVRGAGKVNRQRFDRRFARDVLGLPLDEPLRRFLSGWTGLDVPLDFFQTWVKNGSEPSAETREQLRAVNKLGCELLPLTEQIQPTQNQAVWQAMVLASRCAWLCSEAYVVHHCRAGQRRIDAYNNLLDDCRKAFAADWDATRFPDDPRRNKAAFRGNAMDYGLLILRRLPKA